MHDVLVAGGGPAGLAVALGASRAGLDVVVCDKRQGIIDKACGEGLMPSALRALHALGVEVAGHDLRGITYEQGSTVAHALFSNGVGRGVRRTTLHAALRCALSERGVPLVQRAISDIEQRSDHVRAAGLSARYLVAADGLHSPIRRLVGLSAAGGASPPRWGLRRHFAMSPFSDSVHVTWSDRSEAYVTPVDDDTVGVAILSSTTGSFDAQLAAFPQLRDRLAGAQPVTNVLGAGPLRQASRARVAGRVVLVGDAAGYIDALTGEGLTVSFCAAAELVQCLAEDRPNDYERAWLRVSRRSRWLTSGLLWTRNRPMLAHRIVPFAARHPRLFAAAVDQLGH